MNTRSGFHPIINQLLQDHRVTIAVVDIGGGGGRVPPSKRISFFFFIFMQFSSKRRPNRRSGVGVHPAGKGNRIFQYIIKKKQSVFIFVTMRIEHLVNCGWFNNELYLGGIVRIKDYPWCIGLHHTGSWPTYMDTLHLLVTSGDQNWRPL